MEIIIKLLKIIINIIKPRNQLSDLLTSDESYLITSDVNENNNFNNIN